VVCFVLAAGPITGVGAQEEQAREYRVLAEESTVGFTIRHLGIDNVFGEFSRFDGMIRLGEAPTTLEIRGTVEVSSIDTGNGARDRLLMNDNYFFAERFPTIEYRSVRFEPAEDRSREGWDVVSGRLVGRLRIRDVERRLRLPTTIQRGESGRIRIEMRGSFDRNDFGVTGGFGSAAIADTVNVRVDLVGE
jgi:polyisoprenoid-binding protein YceI